MGPRVTQEAAPEPGFDPRFVCQLRPPLSSGGRGGNCSDGFTKLAPNSGSARAPDCQREEQVVPEGRGWWGGATPFGKFGGSRDEGVGPVRQSLSVGPGS